MSRIATAIRVFAATALFLAYGPVVAQLVGVFAPGLGTWGVQFDTGPVAMGIAAAAMVLLVATPEFRSQGWNNGLFAFVYFAEFCMWAASIAHVLRTEIYFYDEEGISLLLSKRGFTALAAFATAACFLVSTTVTRGFTALFLMVVIAFEFISITPDGDVVSYAEPQTIRSLASLIGLAPTGTEISNFPSIGMYIVYVCALFHSLFLMDDEDFAQPLLPQ